MSADPTQMNADGMKMKRNSDSSSTDLWVLAWSQAPRPLRLSRAWKRRLSALAGAFKALFWNFS